MTATTKGAPALPGPLTCNHWGAGVVTLRDGRIDSIADHPLDPNPSHLNGNMAGSLNGGARVLRPAVRRSYLENGPRPSDGPAPDPALERGREPFVEVSWDTALDLVAAELARIRSDHGNSAIFAGSYGWGSAGRFHHAQTQLKRFLNSIGGFTRSEGNYSYNAAIVLAPHIVGPFYDCVAQSTRLSTVAREGALMVMFGGAPLRSAQIADGGLGKHRLRGAFAECRAAEVEFVSVTPLKTDAMDGLDADWWPVRPGTDVALMMGLAHTLLVEGLHDQSFLDRYTVGFDKLAAYLTGDTDGIAKSADWAAAICEIDADRIRALARKMASRRTIIHMAFSLQRADFGEQPIWMTVALAAMLGQIGLPGGGYCIGYAGNGVIGAANRPWRWAHFSQGENPVAPFIPVAMTTELLEKPNQSFEYDGQRLTFPDTRMVWWAGGNPFHHHQDLNRLRRALQRPETVIVNEINWTAMARHADIVLPVAAATERSDVAAGRQDLSLMPCPKLVDPPGEARTEYAIYCDLEARLGLNQSFSEGLSEDQQLEKLWSDMQMLSADAGRPLPDWETFLAGDMVDYEDPAPDQVFLSEFRADPNAHPRPTPSGKIELYSEVIASFGYDDCPGHPVWRAPRGWAAESLKRYPLHLVSGQPDTRLHSQYDNGAVSLAAKIQGREPMLIHPDDAAARGIADGSVVLATSAYGKCLAGARLSQDIRPGVVFLWTGAWYDPDFTDPDHLDRHGNPNTLTHDLRTSRLAQGPASHSCFVEIAPFNGPLPPIGAYDPPIAPG